MQPQNGAAFRTAGLDLNVNYSLASRARARSICAWSAATSTGSTSSRRPAQVEDQVDQPGRPQFNFVFSPTWTLGQVTLTSNLRCLDRVRRYARNLTDNNPDHAPADLLRSKLWQHDLQAKVALPDGFALHGGVNNLTDEKPDEDSYDLPPPRSAATSMWARRVRLSGR